MEDNNLVVQQTYKFVVGQKSKISTSTGAQGNSDDYINFMVLWRTQFEDPELEQDDVKVMINEYMVLKKYFNVHAGNDNSIKGNLRITVINMKTDEEAEVFLTRNATKELVQRFNEECNKDTQTEEETDKIESYMTEKLLKGSVYGHIHNSDEGVVFYHTWRGGTARPQRDKKARLERLKQKRASA